MTGIMANANKKAKKSRTMEQEDRNYQILRAIVNPIFSGILYPQRTLHVERIPEGACIICPNHSTLADPPMACLAVPKRYAVHIMAKKELLEVPVLGKIFDAIGTFGVDRGSSDIHAIKTAMKVLKSGRKLLMFPEGTRVAERGAGSAKTGVIMLAMKTGAPLLPVYMDHEKRLFHKTNVVFGEPYTIQPAGKHATQAEYEAGAEELLRRIYALEDELH